MSSPVRFFHYKNALHLCFAIILLIIYICPAQESRRLGEPRGTMSDSSPLQNNGHRGARRPKKASNAVLPERTRVKFSLEKGAAKIVSAVSNYCKTKQNNTNFVISPLAIQAAILIRHPAIDLDDGEYKFLEYLGYDLRLASSALIKGTQSQVSSLSSHPSFALGFIYIYNWLTPINDRLRDIFDEYYEMDYDVQEPNATQGIYSFAELYKRVNAWAAGKTKNNIPQLLTGIDISNFTYDYLITLGHFQGDWVWMFKLEKTQSSTFYNDGNSSTVQNVPFLSGRESFRYLDSREPDYNVPPHSIPTGKKHRSTPLYPNCDCHMVALPFTDRRFTMMLLIPGQLNGLHKLQTIPVAMLKQFMKESKPQTIDLKVPKFSIYNVLRLEDIFQEHGMRTIFKNKFHSGLGTYRRPFVETKLIHGNTFSINEQGANVNGAHSYKKHYLSNPIVFRNITIDRPFMFVVMDIINYVPLIVGQVTRAA